MELAPVSVGGELRHHAGGGGRPDPSTEIEIDDSFVEPAFKETIFIDSFRVAPVSNATDAAARMSERQTVVDRAAKTKTIHRNKAARRKSRMSAALKAKQGK